MVLSSSRRLLSQPLTLSVSVQRIKTTSRRRLTSAIKTFIILSTAMCGFLTQSVSGFPDGAPGEACVKHRPNHGAKSQSLDELPYLVQASASDFNSTDTVAVRIVGKPGVYFKGFFIQAIDEKGRWIGQFDPTPFSVSHPECAATTHSENENKEEITVIWRPGKENHGTVRFLASVLKNYKVYWVDAPATAPAPGKKAKA